MSPGDTWRVLAIDPQACRVTSALMTFEQIQQFIGGFAESVPMPWGELLLVDEEGRLKPHLNRAAFGLCGHVILGNAVLIGQEGTEFVDCTMSAGELVRLVVFGGKDPA